MVWGGSKPLPQKCVTFDRIASTVNEFGLSKSQSDENQMCLGPELGLLIGCDGLYAAVWWSGRCADESVGLGA